MKLFFTVTIIMMMSSVCLADEAVSEKNKPGTYTVKDDPSCQSMVNIQGFSATYDSSKKEGNCKVAAVSTNCPGIIDSTAQVGDKGTAGAAGAAQAQVDRK